jgi:hypothetical protein
MAGIVMSREAGLDMQSSQDLASSPGTALAPTSEEGTKLQVYHHQRYTRQCVKATMDQLEYARVRRPHCSCEGRKIPPTLCQRWWRARYLYTYAHLFLLGRRFLSWKRNLALRSNLARSCGKGDLASECTAVAPTPGAKGCGGIPAS